MPAAEKQTTIHKGADASSTKAASFMTDYRARQAGARPLPKSLRRAFEQLIARSEVEGRTSVLH